MFSRLRAGLTTVSSSFYELAANTLNVRNNNNNLQKINQWTTASQDEGEWHRTAEQGAERFMVKWTAAENARARLRRAVI